MDRVYREKDSCDGRGGRPSPGEIEREERHQERGERVQDRIHQMEPRGPHPGDGGVHGERRAGQRAVEVARVPRRVPVGGDQETGQLPQVGHQRVHEDDAAIVEDEIGSQRWKVETECEERADEQEESPARQGPEAPGVAAVSGSIVELSISTCRSEPAPRLTRPSSLVLRAFSTGTSVR